MMNKTNNPIPDSLSEYPWSKPGFDRTGTQSRVQIHDKRIARLLLALHELDKSVAGLDELPQSELSELVQSTIISCGFADGPDAFYAIATVLDAIEQPEPTPGRP